MGMGYAGSFAMTVTDEQVKKVVGDKLFNAFHKAMDASPLDESVMMTDYFDIDNLEEHDITEEDDVKKVKAVMTALQAMNRAFKKATKLNLTRSFHNCDDDGDRYDDVNGAYWELNFGDVFTKTKKAKDFEKLTGESITMSHYVNFG